MLTWHDVMRWHFVSVVFLPSKNHHSLTVKKKLRQTLIEGHAMKHLSSTPQTAKVIRNKGSLRNGHCLEEPKES